jgi:GMP synthase (glutamine-hydrolysing)
MNTVSIIIFDFGSQYTQLIARRLREQGVYCEIVPYNETISSVRAKNPKGLILSGGPASVYDSQAYHIDPDIFEMGLPIFGICYGMQLLVHHFGGTVHAANHHEYGKAKLVFEDEAILLFRNTCQGQVVWMSHGDRVGTLPEGFCTLARSDNSPHAAIHHPHHHIYAVQFHPEVIHSESGATILRNFAVDICGCMPDWTMHHFAKMAIQAIRAQVNDGKVLCAVSGGVDSSVVATLLHQAIGDRVIPIFVDHGLLRSGERESVEQMFHTHLHVPLITVDACDLFLKKLTGITDPEQKRKIIGETFIEVFEIEANKHNGIKWLAQGTLYPDVIESVSVKGPSKTIKSHHNVGGLPEWMQFALIEPLRELFKDEVRALGAELGMPQEMLMRHPFPGPGLAIRIMGEVTVHAIAVLRKADLILLEELNTSGYYAQTWQAFAVLLNVKSVGVMGDNRTYDNTICLRVVEAVDGMTATFAHLPHELLESISTRIINEVEGINRVVYDISSKPPATIEWE